MSDAGGGRRRAISTALLILTSALYVIEERVASFHALPWIQPDSASYLDANVARAPLYPLLLRVVARLPGGLDSWLGPLQHAALLGAAAGLGYRFARVFDLPFAAVVLLLAIAANPAVVSYAFTVLPEALFLAALMAHLTCVLSLAARSSRATAAGVGITAATMALIKPSGYAAIAGLAVLAFEYRKEWRHLAWFAAPALAMLLLASTGNYAVRGVFGIQAQGGYSRAAYVAHLLDDTTPTPYPELTKRIAAQTAMTRRELAALPTLATRYVIGANEYHVVEDIVHREITAEIGRERGRAVTDSNLFPADPDVVQAINGIGSALANAAVRQHPMAYARQVAANLYGLWWMPLIQSPDGAAAVQQAVNEQLVQHPDLDRSPVAFRILPWPAYAAIRLLLVAVSICGVIALPFVWSASKARAAVGYVAVLLHGYFLLVSLAQPGLPRYALTVWPASMVLVFGTAASLRPARRSEADER